MKCERKGCNKKSWSHAYIQENDSMFLVFLCKEHLSELTKLNRRDEKND